MSERKQSASWYIAATHWLTSGFVIPLLFTLAISLILGLIFGKSLENKTTLITFASIIYSPLIYWLGIIYSARYINKKYFIKDGGEIAILSTLYLVVVGGGYRLFKIINGSPLTIEHLGFLLVVIIFYIASKKYIHTTAITAQQNTQDHLNK